MVQLAETRESSARLCPRTYGMVLETEVRFGGALRAARLFATDISAGGVFLECSDAPPKGSVVEVHIPLGERDALLARACVVHTVSVDAAAAPGSRIPGMGVQFLDLDQADQRRLSAAFGVRVVSAGVPEAPVATAESRRSTPRASKTRAETRTPPPKNAPPSGIGSRSKLGRNLAALRVQRLSRANRKRASMATKLLGSARDAAEKGLYIKAACDIQLACQYDAENEEVQRIAAEVIPLANRQRATRAWLQGLHYENLCREDEAMQSFFEAAALDRDNADYQRKAAVLAVQHNDLKAASSYLQEALRTRRRDSELYALLGQVNMELGHSARALRAVERALELDPKRKELRKVVRVLRKRVTSKSPRAR